MNVFRAQIIRARKEHTCRECSQPIEAGTSYKRYVMLYRDAFRHLHIHVKCSRVVSPERLKAVITGSISMHTFQNTCHYLSQEGV